MTGFGYDPGHSIVKARQLGLQAVLYKPFRAHQLLDELEKALTREHPVAVPPASAAPASASPGPSGAASTVSASPALANSVPANPVPANLSGGTDASTPPGAGTVGPAHAV
jgi:hypothetical protein